MPGTVLLDALGTLLALEDPAPHLAAALGVPEADARRAVRAEMAHYRAIHGRASDAAGLAEVRAGCAALVRDELGLARPVHEVERALLASLRFAPFPDVVPALAAWRGAGARLVVCSNWDVSLHEVLDATGLAPLLDAVVTSAEAGVAKPDPRLFARALAGADAATALHVGDDPATDVAGARAAGVPVLLLARPTGHLADVRAATGPERAPGGAPVVRSLLEAVEHWRR